MAGSRFERLFDELDAGFEAAIAHEEDVAADDLALALGQGTDLATAVTRRGWILHSPGSAPAPVIEIGEDYLVASCADITLVLPKEQAILSADPEVPPARASRRGMLEVLRAQARREAQLEIVTGQGSFRGRLVRAAVDHLIVRSKNRDVAIPLVAVQEVRIDPA